MKPLELRTRVAADGSLLITDLPPDAEVVVTVRPDTTETMAEVWAEWCAEVRKDSPFAGMSREEILAVLRQTREEVARELYGD